MNRPEFLKVEYTILDKVNNVRTEVVNGRIELSIFVGIMEELEDMGYVIENVMTSTASLGGK